MYKNLDEIRFSHIYLSIRINVEKNIQDKSQLEDELWELIGQNWDAVKSKQPPPPTIGD